MLKPIKLLLSLTLCLGLNACLILEDDKELERGYVQCGDEHFGVICQPGTYCSGPSIGSCQEGCVSDANCLSHEQCLKNKDTDRVGDCIPTKKPACCQ